MSLTIVGTIAFDSVKTPFGEVDRVIGGAATFTAWAASYLYDRIRLVSIIGDDWPAPELQKMEARGIDLEGVNIVENGKSFYWAGEYDTNMIDRTTLITELNVLDDFDPVLPDSYKNSDFLMLGNLTPQIQIRVMEQMKSRPAFIAMDTMNFWIDIARDDLEKAIRQVDLLSINDEEARLLSGKYNLVEAAEHIMEYGIRYLIIKKGEHGALLFGENKMFFAPALPLPAITDPTGAGDSFAGGLMGYLASQPAVNFQTMKKGLIYGAAMGSFCVEDFSLRKLQSLDQNIIENRIHKLMELSRVD